MVLTPLSGEHGATGGTNILSGLMVFLDHPGLGSEPAVLTRGDHALQEPSLRLHRTPGRAGVGPELAGVMLHGIRPSAQAIVLQVAGPT